MKANFYEFKLQIEFTHDDSYIGHQHDLYFFHNFLAFCSEE